MLVWVFLEIYPVSFRSGRGRKLSGDQITLPTTVDYSSVPKQVVCTGGVLQNTAFTLDKLHQKDWVVRILGDFLIVCLLLFSSLYCVCIS